MLRRDIPGYEGRYQADEDGNIWSYGRPYLGWQVLKPLIGHFGYAQVTLSVSGERRLCMVHRLVAQTFLPNDPVRTHVNHKDLNKQNNCLANLEWTTPAENVKHFYDSVRPEPTERQTQSRQENVKALHRAYREKTHCQRGHEFDRVDTRGRRRCRECANLSARRVRAANTAAESWRHQQREAGR